MEIKTNQKAADLCFRLSLVFTACTQLCYQGGPLLSDIAINLLVGKIGKLGVTPFYSTLARCSFISPLLGRGIEIKTN